MSDFPGASDISYTLRIHYKNGRTESILVKDAWVEPKLGGVEVTGLRVDGRPWARIDADTVARVHEVDLEFWYFPIGEAPR